MIAAVVWAAVATRGGEDTDSALDGSPAAPGVSEGGISGGVPGSADAPDGSPTATGQPTGSEEDASAPVQTSDPAAAASGGSDRAAAKPSEPERAVADGLAASAPVAEPGSTETGIPSGPQGGTAPSASDRQQGQVFTWHDGDREMRVWLQQDLTVNAAGEVVALEASIDASGAPGAQAVFASESGGFMTLPGGVLVVFETELSASEVEAFFAGVGVSMSKVSESDSLPNGWFVETAPGLESLNLANTIASKPGVLLSSPNWEIGVTPR